MTFSLTRKTQGFTVGDLENLPPFEFELYYLLLAKDIKEENERIAELNKMRKNKNRIL